MVLLELAGKGYRIWCVFYNTAVQQNCLLRIAQHWLWTMYGLQVCVHSFVSDHHLVKMYRMYSTVSKMIHKIALITFFYWPLCLLVCKCCKIINVPLQYTTFYLNSHCLNGGYWFIWSKMFQIIVTKNMASAPGIK